MYQKDYEPKIYALIIKKNKLQTITYTELFFFFFLTMYVINIPTG